MTDFVALTRTNRRAYNVDGVPSSGEFDPLKSVDIDIVVAIQDAMNAMSIGNITVLKDTNAHLLADLAHADSSIALVYEDPNPDLIDLYRKDGASGTGTWTALGLKLSTAAQAQLTQVDALQTTSQALIDSFAFVPGDFKPYFSDQVAGPITADENGNILSAQYINGPATNGFALKYYYLADVQGSVGSRTVWIAAPGITPFQISNDNDVGDNFGAMISGGYVTWLNNNGGVITQRREPLFIDGTAINSGVTTVVLLAGIGQSTSNGTASVAAVTTSAPASGYVMMWNAGIRILRHDQGPLRQGEYVEDGALLYLTDAIEGVAASAAETQWTQAAYECQKRLGNTYAVVAATVGIGSQPYQNVKKGTPPYENLMRVAKRTWLAAKLTGRAFDMVLVCPEFEGNQYDTQAAYLGYMTELQANVTTDVNALTNRTGEIFLIVDGYGSACAYGTQLSYEPFAQLQWALDNPTKGGYATPTYIRESVSGDGIHGTKEGNALDGAYMGRTAALKLLGDANPDPLYITGPGTKISSTVWDFDVHLPKNAVGLTTSSTVVSAITNHGVTCHRGDTDAAITVSSVAINAGKIRVTLSAPPAGVALWVEFGWRGLSSVHSGPTTGNRSPINDNCADTSYFGTQMANHLAIQRVSVTF